MKQVLLLIRLRYGGGGQLSPLSPRFRRPYELTYIVEQSENRKKVLMGMHILKYDTYFWCLFKVTSILSCFMKFWGHVVNEPYFSRNCMHPFSFQMNEKLAENSWSRRRWKNLNFKKPIYLKKTMYFQNHPTTCFWHL